MRRSRPLVIAHRGASAIAPEGTRAAIRAAIRSGADAIELDVQLTREGRLVVFHDDRLERTTEGRGRLAAMTYAVLARLDAGSWFHPRFTGERILLAEEALRLIPRRVPVNLELKRTRRPAMLVSRVLSLLQRAARRHRVILSSFDPALLRRLSGRGLALALICRHDPERAMAQALRLGCRAWHPTRALVTRRRIQRAHAAGLAVHIWTVNDPREARRLARWKVDGLFTDDPGRLLKALR